MQLRDKTANPLPLELPAKRWFRNRDQAFVKERKEALQAYLNAVLHIIRPSDCPPLESFFSTVTKDPSSKDFGGTQRFLTLEQATKEFGLKPPKGTENSFLTSSDKSWSWLKNLDVRGKIIFYKCSLLQFFLYLRYLISKCLMYQEKERKNIRISIFRGLKREGRKNTNQKLAPCRR